MRDSMMKWLILTMNSTRIYRFCELAEPNEGTVEDFGERRSLDA